jgi:hypothetical protein
MEFAWSILSEEPSTYKAKLAAMGHSIGAIEAVLLADFAGEKGFSGEAGSKLPDIANAMCSSLSLSCELRSQPLRRSPTDGVR